MITLFWKSLKPNIILITLDYIKHAFIGIYKWVCSRVPYILISHNNLMPEILLNLFKIG